MSQSVPFITSIGGRRAGLTKVLLATAVLALLIPAAQAQWKWRDKDGRITVSDRPPPREVPDKDILQRPNLEFRRAPVAAATGPAPAAAAASGAASGGAPAAPTALEREVAARRRAAEAEQAAKAKAEEEKATAARAENCRAARGHLAALESGQRIVRTNERGEREFIDDAQRAAEMRRARDAIASDCR